MSLRHRLLIAYSIVVLLSVGTIGIVALELRRSREIFSEFQRWNAFVLTVQKLRSAVPPPEVEPDDEDFLRLLVDELSKLNEASDFLDVTEVRHYLHQVYLEYGRWSRLPPEQRADKTHIVTNAIDNVGRAIEIELDNLDAEANRQVTETSVLLVVVAALTVLNILGIGWLLSQGFLKPMQRLGRQVEALGRDEPPDEPLISSPPEMANLAQALDRARLSLREMREQLLDAERLTTIGQFAAQLAHNLRNPLANIRATAQLTTRQPSVDDRTGERMQDVIASVDRLDRWVARLMEIARGEPTPPQQLDIQPTLKRVREGLEAEVTAKDLELRVDLPEAELICLHDPQTLEHALIAIITNAIEASPLGEPIDLEATVCNDSGADFCRITVRDRGPGLPAEDPERVFDFAYSTKVRGMGLGLALTRQALKRQGAAAHAENHPEGGAVFRIDLPMPETRSNATSFPAED